MVQYLHACHYGTEHRKFKMAADRCKIEGIFEESTVQKASLSIGTEQIRYDLQNDIFPAIPGHWQP
jgi:hypothetical protein